MPSISSSYIFRPTPCYSRNFNERREGGFKSSETTNLIKFVKELDKKSSFSPINPALDGLRKEDNSLYDKMWGAFAGCWKWP